MRPRARREPGEEASSASLVEALLRGESDALARVWDSHASTVHRLLRRLLGPGAELDDLAQVVFLTFFRRIERLRDRSALESFLLGIAVNVARKELRRRTAARWLQLGGIDELPAPPGPDHEATVALARFYSLLDRLDGETRSIFVLRHVEQRELEDVATIAGLSLATVKRRLRHAEERLATWMRRDETLRTYAPSAPREGST